MTWSGARGLQAVVAEVAVLLDRQGHVAVRVRAGDDLEVGVGAVAEVERAAPVQGVVGLGDRLVQDSAGVRDVDDDVINIDAAARLHRVELQLELVVHPAGRGGADGPLGVAGHRQAAPAPRDRGRLGCLADVFGRHSPTAEPLQPVRAARRATRRHEGGEGGELLHDHSPGRRRVAPCVAAALDADALSKARCHAVDHRPRGSRRTSAKSRLQRGFRARTREARCPPAPGEPPGKWRRQPPSRWRLPPPARRIGHPRGPGSCDHGGDGLASSLRRCARGARRRLGSVRRLHLRRRRSGRRGGSAPHLRDRHFTQERRWLPLERELHRPAASAVAAFPASADSDCAVIGNEVCGPGGLCVLAPGACTSNAECDGRDLRELGACMFESPCGSCASNADCDASLGEVCDTSTGVCVKGTGGAGGAGDGAGRWEPAGGREPAGRAGTGGHGGA